ncbi:MAG TPA: hypothetical protein VLI46_00555 [Ramlibacter sp.]|nr:hypothetical protein [Ramlibacter sp.]
MTLKHLTARVATGTRSPAHLDQQIQLHADQFRLHWQRVQEAAHGLTAMIGQLRQLLAPRHVRAHGRRTRIGLRGEPAGVRRRVQGQRSEAAVSRKLPGVYLRASPQCVAQLPAVEDWLFGSSELPVFFFGDLDYAGMQILANLRAVFPGAQAWQPGYVHLAAILESGGGHLPDQAGKGMQSDPGDTGCPFADGQLLPLIRKHARFVDQEAFDAGF